MKCTSCGTELQENARFCGTCGTKVEATPVNIPETPAPESAPVITPPVAPAPPAAPVAPPAAPAAPAAPVAPPAAPVATAAPVYTPNAVPVYNYAPQPMPVQPQQPVDDRRTRVMSTGGYMAALFLMSIPVVGFILQIVWAAGAARNLNRRHLARGYLFLSLIIFAVTVILGLLGASAFSTTISNFLRSLNY